MRVPRVITLTEYATMTIEMARRKTLFKAALALNETTQGQWAVDNGVTPTHLSQVLAEKRESQRLLDLVDLYIKNTSGLKRSALVA
jgi:hypothetical protein